MEKWGGGGRGWERVGTGGCLGEGQRARAPVLMPPFTKKVKGEREKGKK